MARFFLPPSEWAAPAWELRGDEAHHAARVLRLKQGDSCIVFDGCGRAAHAVVAEPPRSSGVRRGWKKADGSPALNPDLWAQALEQEARHKITYVWVKGHAGHPENERCDQLAVAQSQAHGGRQGR